MYASLDALVDLDASNHTRINTVTIGNASGIVINFGNKTPEQIHNDVFTVIGLLAGLKDHLANKIGSTETEAFINSNISLCLLMDLNNAEKHGYPLTRTRRSKKDPKLTKLSEALHLDNGEGKTPSYITINPDTGIAEAHGNPVIAITGEVIDKDNNFIISLEELINSSLEAIEKFISDKGITNG